MNSSDLKTLIKKILLETIQDSNPTISPVKPITRPDIKPDKPTPKRQHPLKPTRPNISPKPKAISHDVQLFVKNRQKISETMNIGDYPDYIDPKKRELLAGEELYVKQILPDLAPAEESYLEMVSSEGYKRTVDQLSRYLNIDTSQLKNKYPNYPSFLQIVFEKLKEIEEIESKNIKELERIALTVVLDLEEYSMIKDLVESESIKFDIKLGPADLSQAIASDELDSKMKNGLSVSENLNSQLYKITSGNGDTKLKRELANYLTQGDAVNKFYLFNLLSNELNRMDPSLIPAYGIVSAIVHLLYYSFPMLKISKAMLSAAAVGSEEVIPDGNSYIIKARGNCLPFLIHEIVKGIGDYISMDIAPQEELDTELADDEISQLMAGPELDRQFRKFIPTNKLKLMPLIKKLFLKLSKEDIKDVFLGGAKATYIIKKLISQAESDMEDFEN